MLTNEFDCWWNINVQSSSSVTEFTTFYSKSLESLWKLTDPSLEYSNAFSLMTSHDAGLSIDSMIVKRKKDFNSFRKH